MSTLGELSSVLGGRLLPGDAVGASTDAPLGPIATDSRKIESGEVFWAIRGPNHDGEDFVAAAFGRGAAGAIVARDIAVPANRWAIRVDDTRRALNDWARWKRRQCTGTVIAVTGSAGKSTTQQMIHVVLQIAAARHGQPEEFQPSSRRPLEHDGDRACGRLRRAGVGREPARRDRLAGRTEPAEDRGDYVHRRRSSRRFRQSAAHRPVEGGTAGRAAGGRPGCVGRRSLAAQRGPRLPGGYYVGGRFRGLRPSRRRRSAPPADASCSE